MIYMKILKKGGGGGNEIHAPCACVFYGKCWSKLLLTKQTFDLLFSQSCDIKSEFSYIICSYLKRLVIQSSLKCTETLQIFFDPFPNPIGIFY
jgi:hypothetical protein